MVGGLVDMFIGYAGEKAIRLGVILDILYKIEVANQITLA